MKRIYLYLLIIFISLQVVGQQQIKLEDIWASPKFYPRSVRNIRSMDDGVHYTVLAKGNILRYAYSTGNLVDTILSASQFTFEDQKVSIEGYDFNKDESKLLISSETEAIYRHSDQSYFFIYNRNDGEITKVSDDKIRLAEFSPNSKKIGFVKDNNLYIKDMESGKLDQVTNDGKDRHIINGTCDWVYEEEFSFTKAWFWSQEGNYVAFYKFDESEVKEFTMTYHGELYPDLYKFKYPKAGEDNSIVTIHVYNVKDRNLVNVDIGENVDQYIPRIRWSKSDDQLVVYRLNRLQNKLEFLLVDANQGSSNVFYTESNKYYIDINDNFLFTDPKTIVLTSEREGYNQLYALKLNGQLTKLFKEDKDVDELLGYNKSTNELYFTAAYSSPINRELMKLNVDSKQVEVMSDIPGTHNATFSSNYQYYFSTYSDANTPPLYELKTLKGDVVKVLEDNNKLKGEVSDYGFTKMEFGDLTTADGINLNYSIILPPKFKKKKKYPVLMYVYGGPGSQTVTNSWGYFNFVWFQMLAQKGYIVVSVDNRGTGFRGEEFKKLTYKELGKFETIDQIGAAKYFGQKKYIDASRIGMFGWSYGGYMSTLCMTKGADVFSAGIAVAPVTNWRYYDNIYTERYMRTPQNNASGYDDNSPINHVKKLKGNYMLVHGSTDDNVHVQNTMDLATALVNANKQFELMIYPNKNHGIYGGYTRLHLYTKMTDFLLENL